MSTPFTAVTAGAAWQSAVYLEELTHAFAEVFMCLGYGRVIYDGTWAWATEPVTKYFTTGSSPRLDFFKNIQEWIETFIIFQERYWVNHTDPLENTGALKMFDGASFRSAAGLPADGFRRATEWSGVGDPTFSYGVAQAGDVLGPWLIEDLQLALSTLRWMRCFYNLGFVANCFPAVSRLITITSSAESGLYPGDTLEGLYNGYDVGNRIGDVGNYSGIPLTRNACRQYGIGNSIDFGVWGNDAVGLLSIRLSVQYGDPPQPHDYALEVEFEDTTHVEVLSDFEIQALRATNIATSHTASSFAVSATISPIYDLNPSNAYYRVGFSVVVKPPFTYQNA